MAEYVDRLAVYEKACRGCNRHGDEVGSCYSDEPCERLAAAFALAEPVDVAPVVRCMGCKESRPIVDATSHITLGAWCSLLDVLVRSDGFCSFGKRKEGDGNG